MQAGFAMQQYADILLSRMQATAKALNTFQAGAAGGPQLRPSPSLAEEDQKGEDREDEDEAEEGNSEFKHNPSYQD